MANNCSVAGTCSCGCGKCKEVSLWSHCWSHGSGCHHDCLPPDRKR